MREKTSIACYCDLTGSWEEPEFTGTGGAIMDWAAASDGYTNTGGSHFDLKFKMTESLSSRLPHSCHPRAGHKREVLTAELGGR
jgi:hypothetical protein